MISVRDTLLSVKSSDAIALEQIEVAKAEQTALIAQVAEEKVILQENLDLAVSDATDAQQRVEDARAAFAADIDAIKAEALTDVSSLKARLLAIADSSIAGVEWESQWVLPHLEDTRDRIPKAIDEAIAEIEGMISWIRPRPVDPEEKRKTIARDLKMYNEEQAAKAAGTKG